MGKDEEHPDDRKMREEGEVYGQQWSQHFCPAHGLQMMDLIGTYNDQEAHDLLDTLRERFWSRDWAKNGRRARDSARFE